MPQHPAAIQHYAQALTDPQVNRRAAVGNGHRDVMAGCGVAWFRRSAASGHACPVPLARSVRAVHNGATARKSG